MFKQILIITIIIIISYFIFKVIFIANHKLYLSKDIIKYTMSDHDKDFLKFNSSETKLIDLNSEYNIFYTETPWSTKNNNYSLFNERYYIIEPGYYYYLNKDQITINNKDSIIKLLKSKKNK